MKLFLCALFLAFFVAPSPLCAQEGEPDLYRITDIAVDVTATTGTEARTKAIAEAQRTAFDQLVGRLSNKGAASAPDETTLAGLVQAFDVQKETPLAGRYIGILTVQFKPSATRAYLLKKGIDFSETRSRPLIILPVVADASRATLWTERTQWRTAWEEEARQSGIVPLIVPAGDLDDIALISGNEAIEGKQAALASMASRYEAGGIVVAVIHGDLQDGAQQTMDLIRYDALGRPIEKATSPGSGSGAQSVKQARASLENQWKQVRKKLEGPVTHMRLTVPVPTLAAWADVRGRLARVQDISRTNLLGLTRGAAQIEIEYHGDLDSLRGSLDEHGFRIEAQPGPLGGHLLVNK